MIDLKFIKGFKEIGEIEGLADGIISRDGNLTRDETLRHAKNVSYLAHKVQEAMHEMFQEILKEKN